MPVCEDCFLGADPGNAAEASPATHGPISARIASEAGAGRLILTHFDAGVYQSLLERTESERIAAGIFAATTAAVDGPEVIL